MSDANKTEITKRVTAHAVDWLAGRGFRPVESEVPVAEGWVADLAGAVSATRTEAQKLKLLSRRPQDKRADEGWEEHHARYQKWNETYNAIPHPLTAIVEVKTSRSDFRRDRKWERPAESNLLYVAMPTSLALVVDVPDHIGVLVLNEESMRCKWPAKLQEVSREKVLSLIYAVALRRDNHTKHERSREFQRQAREHNNERVNRERFSTAFQVATRLASGEFATVDEALHRCRVRCKLPKAILTSLETLVASSSQKGQANDE